MDHDGPRLLDRRRVLQLLGIAGVATLAGCGDDDDTASSTSRIPAPTGSASTAPPPAGSAVATVVPAATECSQIPEETAGPFPGDGSNGPDVLTEDGVVRADITSSFGSSTTVADGVPVTINLTLLDVTNGCSAMAGAAVYIWHCDRGGGYSLYSQGVEGENYLRGVQESDADGRVMFQSVFPACYSGRWPHIHFEVYESLEAATSGGTRIATSQVALPEDICSAVYATDGYEQSVQNLSRVSLATDNVFGDDGGVSQLASVIGAVDVGFTIALTVPVDPTGESTGSPGGGDGSPGGGGPGGPGGGPPPSGDPGGYRPPGY